MISVEWAPEAEPQTIEEVRRSPSHPEIVAAAKKRGITSVVHFTSVPGGVVGILSSSAVKARRDLPSEQYVRHVYEENAADRSRDYLWHGYINLSVTRINLRMFEFSQRSHPNGKWAVLEFHPDILGYPGVVFSTTNNAYPVTHRCTGLRGFEQIFDSSIPWGYHGSIHTRRDHKSDQTTDPQAEVLFPYELSLEHLHTITVPDESTHDSVIGALAIFPNHKANVRTSIDSKAFR